MFWFFGCEACGILGPQPGIKPAPPALECEVLTTGLPAKSLTICFYIYSDSFELHRNIPVHLLALLLIGIKGYVATDRK